MGLKLRIISAITAYGAARILSFAMIMTQQTWGTVQMWYYKGGHIKQVVILDKWSCYTAGHIRQVFTLDRC